MRCIYSYATISLKFDVITGPETNYGLHPWQQHRYDTPPTIISKSCSAQKTNKIYPITLFIVGLIEEGYMYIVFVSQFFFYFIQDE